MINEALAIVLAGDSGPGLQPLTLDRAIPAIPFGGKYRIIDFPLANCLHSGLRKVLVLTQYKSFSLQKHLRDGWSIFNPELGEYVTPVPPQMRHGEKWYAGEADAIYQNLYLLERSGAKWVFVISANNIYRMDYSAMLKHHCEKNADVTIAGVEVNDSITKVESGFHESVDGRVTKIIAGSHALDDGETQTNSLVNIGVTIFSIDLLIEMVSKDAGNADSSHDLIRDIIPQLLDEKKVCSYAFGKEEGRVTPDHYWCAINTVDTYYAANMALLESEPPIDLYQSDWPIRTYHPQSPPARTVPGEEGEQGISINSIVSNGVVIKGGGVQQSILSPNVFVDDLASVYGSLLFNGVRVGKGAQLRNCIIDKDVVVPDGESIGFDKEHDMERFTISDNGIVVVPKGYQFDNHEG